MRLKWKTNSNKYSTIPHILNNSIKFHDTTLNVYPLIIFQQIILCKWSINDLENYLPLEMAPYPLSLFNHWEMRKAKKSASYRIFKQTDEIIGLGQQKIVVDGGFLLHKVVWKNELTIQEICNRYIKYVKKHYCGKCSSIVFDGCIDLVNSIKIDE